MAEATDPSFEALRLAQEAGLPAFAIDLFGDDEPLQNERLPDPYALRRIGLKKYYEAYLASNPQKTDRDNVRELYMARKLKELSLKHDKVLFIGGMHHVQNLL